MAVREVSVFVQFGEAAGSGPGKTVLVPVGPNGVGFLRQALLLPPACVLRCGGVALLDSDPVVADSGACYLRYYCPCVMTIRWRVGPARQGQAVGNGWLARLDFNCHHQPPTHPFLAAHPLPNHP
jgi:hypothetical protein